MPGVRIDDENGQVSGGVRGIPVAPDQGDVFIRENGPAVNHIFRRIDVELRILIHGPPAGKKDDDGGVTVLFIRSPFRHDPAVFPPDPGDLLQFFQSFLQGGPRCGGQGRPAVGPDIIHDQGTGQGQLIKPEFHIQQRIILRQPFLIQDPVIQQLIDGRRKRDIAEDQLPVAPVYRKAAYQKAYGPRDDISGAVGDHPGDIGRKGSQLRIQGAAFRDLSQPAGLLQPDKSGIGPDPVYVRHTVTGQEFCRQCVC